MNVVKVKKKLQEKYPGAAIFENRNKEGVVREMLCEVDPSRNHPEYSLAVAVADNSLPHKHIESVETYTLISGTLTVFIDDEKHVLKNGKKEALTIHPGQVHYVEGDETWFECYSEPGWVPQDHILVD